MKQWQRFRYSAAYVQSGLSIPHIPYLHNLNAPDRIDLSASIMPPTCRSIEMPSARITLKHPERQPIPATEPCGTLDPVNEFSPYPVAPDRRYQVNGSKFAGCIIRIVVPRWSEADKAGNSRASLRHCNLDSCLRKGLMPIACSAFRRERIEIVIRKVASVDRLPAFYMHLSDARSIGYCCSADHARSPDRSWQKLHVS
jgi:hypothetical protein